MLKKQSLREFITFNIVVWELNIVVGSHLYELVAKCRHVACFETFPPAKWEAVLDQRLLSH